MPLPDDYLERVYAGVLGKIIGVYLGRPFEGWSYERIMINLGEIWTYVHERLGLPLVVTDDDISGTFTFLRALPDYDHTPDLTPAQIGQTWLNYIIENRAILWWGGRGHSTAHTAFLNLKGGMAAPHSGSTAVNGPIVAEQIGAQIFVDGWAMVAPGDPERAADLARRAASVSYDGEAIYGAQVIAAMESAAFVEPDINRLIEVGLSVIPADSVIARLIGDIREWHAQEPDWRKAREQLAAFYGYDKYGGNCHVVPNHGLIILSLLYGDDDFQRTQMIVNTAGWDTDCNAGNVGCLLGIKNGLAGLDAGPDWRGPVADRLYLPTADGGRAITDAATEAYHVANVGRALAGLPPLRPKDGARFHFELPGAVQGFQAEAGDPGAVVPTLVNVAGHSESGTRSLAVRFDHLAPGLAARISTATFIPPEARAMPGYGLLASPTLYPGQTVRARISADPANPAPVTCGLYLRTYDRTNALETLPGPTTSLPPGGSHVLAWRVPDTGGAPVAQIGLVLSAAQAMSGTVYLDTLAWHGSPDVLLVSPGKTRGADGDLWRRAWVSGADHFYTGAQAPYRVIQNEGRGLVSQGTREWTDLRVSVPVSITLAAAGGIGVRVQGMRRYYALLLYWGDKLRLVKVLDGETVLAETDFPWTMDTVYDMHLSARGTTITAWIDRQQVLQVTDDDRPLTGGAIALLSEDGSTAFGDVRVRPATT